MRRTEFNERVMRDQATSGTFDERLLVPGPIVGEARLPGIAGRWMVSDELLLTAIALPVETATARSAVDGSVGASSARAASEPACE